MPQAPSCMAWSNTATIWAISSSVATRVQASSPMTNSRSGVWPMSAMKFIDTPFAWMASRYSA